MHILTTCCIQRGITATTVLKAKLLKKFGDFSIYSCVLLVQQLKIIIVKY